MINVALDELVREGCELRAFSTLGRMAGAIRTEVNNAFFAGIRVRMEQDGDGVDCVLGLLDAGPLTGRSVFARLRDPAPAPRLTKFREHLKWLAELPPAELIHVAGEARVQDAATMRDFALDKRLALLACLLHRTRVRARDEVVMMFGRRIAAIRKRGRAGLEETRERHRAETGRLREVFGQVLAGAREAVGEEEGLSDSRCGPISYMRADRSLLWRARQSFGEQITGPHRESDRPSGFRDTDNRQAVCGDDRAIADARRSGPATHVSERPGRIFGRQVCPGFGGPMAAGYRR